MDHTHLRLKTVQRWGAFTYHSWAHGHGWNNKDEEHEERDKIENGTKCDNNVTTFNMGHCDNNVNPGFSKQTGWSLQGCGRQNGTRNCPWLRTHFPPMAHGSRACTWQAPRWCHQPVCILNKPWAILERNGKNLGVSQDLARHLMLSEFQSAER